MADDRAAKQRALARVIADGIEPVLGPAGFARLGHLDDAADHDGQSPGGRSKIRTPWLDSQPGGTPTKVK